MPIGGCSTLITHNSSRELSEPHPAAAAKQAAAHTEAAKRPSTHDLYSYLAGTAYLNPAVFLEAWVLQLVAISGRASRHSRYGKYEGTYLPAAWKLHCTLLPGALSLWLVLQGYN